MEENRNNKKLIGTIIGVIFFVVLVAGATFAWLTFTANVNNGVYNTRTLNFAVNYVNGTDVSSLPMLAGDVNHSIFNTSSYPIINVKAAKINLDGTLSLKLHTNDTTDSTALATAGCIRYAVCVGTACSSSATTAFSQISGVNTGVVDVSSFDTNRDIVLYTGPLEASLTDYYIYMWIDNELITNSEVGLTYSGYIHAFAVQDELGGNSSSGS